MVLSGRFGRILTMKKHISPFDYPIVIRQNMGFITISVPDLNIIMAEEIPVTKKLEKNFLMKIAKTVGLAWVKVSHQIHRKQARRRLPSKTKAILSPRYSNKPLKIAAAALVLGVSENTLRRMVARKQISCVKTAKGHRRFTESSLNKWLVQSSFKSNESVQ